MKIRSAMAAMVIAAGAFSLTACDFPSACEGLTVSERDIQAAADGYEVEKEDSMGNECQLSQDGQTWSVDD